MSFVTNNNSRRTKRARVNGVGVDPLSILSASAVVRPFVSHPPISTIGRKPVLTDTVIGSHNSRSLSILGGSARSDFHHGTNPDGRDIPMGTSGEDGGLVDGEPNSTLAHPPHPITFNGPGYLAFVGAVGLPNIVGPTHIKDDVTIAGDTVIDGGLTVTGTITSTPTAPTAFTPVIQDALGNELTGVSVTSTYLSGASVDYFEANIAWTGFGDLDPAEEIRLTGVALTNYSAGSSPDVFGHGGIATTAIGGEFQARVVPGQSYVLLEELDQSAGTAPTSV